MRGIKPYNPDWNLMEFPDVLDTRELAVMANAAYEVGTRLIKGDPDLTNEEIADANHTLSSMRYALRDLGFTDVPYEEYADRWMQVGEENGTRLVKDEALADAWEESALETGLFTKESLKLFKGAVDWAVVARNQNLARANFNHPSRTEEITYWVF